MRGLKTFTVFEPSTIREKVLNMAFRGQSVHVPCAFSLVEILSVLYKDFLHFNKENPSDPARDYLILSKGHGVMSVYACLEGLGFLKEEDLHNYFKNGSELRGLSESNIPGIEVTSGSLGHGLPIATGIALGMKLSSKPNRIFCIAGDGEMNEGPMWESMLFAAQHKLSNLCLIVDANQFQAMGKTENILSLEPLKEKFTSFGFECAEVDGHDAGQLKEVIARLLSCKTKPQALIARTVKGKGVSFMENENVWHYTRLNEETYAKALKEVRKTDA